MGKPYSIDLRERVQAEITCGQSRRAAARRYDVSASFAVKLADRVSRTGSAQPARQGRPPGGGKLAPYLTALLEWVEAEPDITMPELAAKLKAEKDVTTHPASLSRVLLKAGLSFKKTLLATEAGREDVRQARDEWKAHRQPRMREAVHRLVFLDETGTTTKMTRLRGRARRGARLKADAPFGHWATQTFIAGLRCDGLTAPWVVDQPMNRQIFDTYVETQLAPTLQPGDVVILDNLASHKSAKAEAILKRRGAWFLFLPPYSPDLNPIEMAFAKLKAALRKAAARSIDALVNTIAVTLADFTAQECLNFFAAAGYDRV
ncbi:MAG: IS630 family transposase [Gammaproteobacteria bacterium]